MIQIFNLNSFYDVCNRAQTREPPTLQTISERLNHSAVELGSFVILELLTSSHLTDRGQGRLCNGSASHSTDRCTVLAMTARGLGMPQARIP